MDQPHLEDPSENLDQSDDAAPEEEVEAVEPVYVNIRYAGNTYTVPEHLADAWHAREDDFRKKLSDRGDELGRLRQQTQPAPRQEQSQEVDPVDDLTEFLASPSKVLAQREKRLREEVKAELRQELDMKSAQQQYWGTFYNENKDLAGQEDVIEFLVTKHFQDLKDLSPAESRIELAKKAKSFLGRSTAGKPLPGRQVQGERPSSSTPPTRPKPVEEPPKRKYGGLGAELAAQAERRRRAQYNIPKDSD